MSDPVGYLLTIAYVGTEFAGWQLQEGQRTVQGELERVVQTMWGGERRAVEGSGRTDAGVHALGQTASFVAPRKLDVERLRRAMNFHLPDDVRVMRVVEREPSFHARYDVCHKTYEYRLWCHSVFDPFLYNRAWHLPQEVDWEAVKRAIPLLVGEQDYAAMASNSGTPRLSTVRHVQRLALRRRGALVCVRVTADGFLYHMVRNIVGALVAVGRRRLTCDALESLMKSRDRTLAPASAPAFGLYLKSVSYRPKSERLRRARLRAQRRNGQEEAEGAAEE